MQNFAQLHSKQVNFSYLSNGIVVLFLDITKQVSFLFWTNS